MSPHFKESHQIAVSAFREGDVLLPCFIPANTSPQSCYRVKWTKRAADHSTKLSVILARPETPKFPDAEGVKWEGNGKENMSLSLTRLDKSDEGQYSCEIWQGWDCILVKNFSLKVKGNIAPFVLSILASFKFYFPNVLLYLNLITPLSDCKSLHPVRAAPSTPAALHCPVDKTPGQHQPQNVSWSILKGGTEIPILQSPDVSQLRESFGLDGLSLNITSVKLGDSGWYRCKYLLGQNLRCFDVKLQVRGEILKNNSLLSLLQLM